MARPNSAKTVCPWSTIQLSLTHTRWRIFIAAASLGLTLATLRPQLVPTRMGERQSHVLPLADCSWSCLELRGWLCGPLLLTDTQPIHAPGRRWGPFVGGRREAHRDLFFFFSFFLWMSRMGMCWKPWQLCYVVLKVHKHIIMGLTEIREGSLSISILPSNKLTMNMVNVLDDRQASHV